MFRILSMFLMFLFATAPALAQDAPVVPDSGNTTWVLVSAALVMLMTPGLAFFYAGMVSRKNVVSTLLQNFVALAVVGLIWVVVGFSLVFTEGPESFTGLIGGTSAVMLEGLSNSIWPGKNVSAYAFMAFQMMFACIAPALITGAIAERVEFKGWIILMGLWSLLVYVPVAHWVWGPKGWILEDGGLDFAGGLVVHVTAGVAGLVAALMYGKRSHSNESAKANDVTMVMLGAALLWFGWFGFSAGSALSAGHLASHAFVTTFIGAASAFVSWMLVDWLKSSKPSAVGAAIGLVVGLVAITPAAGYVSVGSAIVMCAIAGVVCNLFAHFIKTQTRLDDALDVFACHGVGGMLGALMTGLFASKVINPSITNEGWLVGGDPTLFISNLTGLVAVIIYTAVVTYGLIKLVSLFTTIRVTQEQEHVGLDTALHGEVSRFHDRKSYS